jgi:hypothetical protein
MPLLTRVVQAPARDVAIPDALSPSAQLLADLANAGVLETLGASLRLSRKGGFTGIPLVAFVLTFLSAGCRMGIRPFTSTFRRPLKRVAAVAGCIRFPSSASVSRAFSKIDAPTADRFADAVLSLAATPALAQVLTHPAALHRDARGDPLHVLDIDPSVQAFRLRDLVESDDHPEPERQVPGVPGYTGQYRGEVRVRHIAVCAAGAGVWLGYRMSDDHPHLAPLFTSALKPALAVMATVGVPRDQVLVRGDGEFGAAGVARAIVDLGVQLLVRISRYPLLDRPEVIETLHRARWESVQAGATREREATDLGTVMLHPAAKSADAGSPGVALRVVVCRRMVDTPQVTYGTLREGYQIELFATTLSADRWSAGDIVALYAGRSVMENRFAQEDRELALGRTFSYNAPGQGVFTALGLFLWNHWVCVGFQESPPAVPPAPTPRVDRRLPDAPPSPPPTLAQPVVEQPPDASVARLPIEPVEVPCHDTPPISPSTPTDPFPRATPDERATVTSIMKAAFRTLLLVPGWEIDTAGHVRCPNERRLFPFAVTTPGVGRMKPQLLIRTDVGACDGCHLRGGCFASTRPNIYKQVARAITDSQAPFMTSFLERHPPTRRLPRIAVRPPRLRAPPNRPPPEAAGALVCPATPTNPGPWECASPTLAPAALRHRARARHAGVRVEVRIGRLAGPGQSSASAKRRTWAARENRWRLHGPVCLTLHVPHRSPKCQRLHGV